MSLAKLQVFAPHASRLQNYLASASNLQTVSHPVCHPCSLRSLRAVIDDIGTVLNDPEQAAHFDRGLKQLRARIDKSFRRAA